MSLFQLVVVIHMDLKIQIATQVDIAIARLVIRAKLVPVALQDIINPMDIIVMNTRAGVGAGAEECLSWIAQTV